MEISGIFDAEFGVARMAARFPERAAVICDGHPTLSFRELDRRANQMARVLAAHGLGKGDHVALLCCNRPEFAEVATAALQCGVVLSPVNWHLSPDDVAYVLDNCGARAFIAEGRFADAARHAARQCARSLALCLSVGEPIEGFGDYAAVLAGESGAALETPELGGLMFYTSGTTGRPKGVRQLAEATQFGPFIRHFATLYDYQPERGDAVMATGPLYHGGSMIMCTVVALNCGVTTVLIPRWNSEECLRLIERHRISQAFFVPTMFHRLLALPEATRRRYDLRSLRLILHGGAPTPIEDKRAMIRWLGPILTEVYGATEGFSLSISSEEWLRKPGSAGRAQPGTVRVLDGDLAAMPAGQVGTLYIKPAGAFEYFNDPEKTAASHQGEFVTVGDMGYLDEEGYLFVTGRSAELILSGGSNIYPAEIDDALLANPAVLDAAAFGVPDREWGEVVHALVIPVPGVAVDDSLRQALLAHCRERLGTLRSPRTLEFVATLPRNDAGKLLRTRLREQYRDGQPS
ncbi:MAG: AMP-binding protein [Gammaproteobacteria bacterium]|nr:AMP-binding protein [Gammaproteobacteria bacterium]MBK7170702.1 AMP-binding protein [Gammaproteobacteria bacterium]